MIQQPSQHARPVRLGPAFCLQAVLAAMLVFSCACSRDESSRPQAAGPRYRMTVGGVALDVELAATDADRSRGFMYRQKIPEGTGMLFVFEDQRPRSFWMKNTPTALSIAFADTAGRIVSISDMRPFDHSSTHSNEPAKYALEVPRGWFDKQGVKVGDRIELTEEIEKAIQQAGLRD